MRRFARPVGWLLLAAAAGIVLVIVGPGLPANAGPSARPCDKPTNGKKVGWQHNHPSKRESCVTTGSVTASVDADSANDDALPAGGDVVAGGPSLIRIPVDQTEITMSAGPPSRPAAPPTALAPKPTVEPIPIQVTSNSPAGVDNSLVLIGVVLGFILAVSGVVLGAGRRGGRHQAP